MKSGLSIAVALRTNFERLYTGQTKHKIVSAEIRKIIVALAGDALTSYFQKNPGQLKDLRTIIKTNAKARREGDKVRSAVVKNALTNWGSYKMKNYDPCTAKGLKEYKELFIIEGDSAKGSLKKARDPRFQALFAIRGVSANVFKMTLDQVIGPKGNREFTDLVTVMGCNAGIKFDLNKLQFHKIILASDADVDGLFIRSLLMAFFFKLFPEIIQDGRLFIAEPPLYRVDDKKNPFVINKADYIRRYVAAVTKEYQIGWHLDADPDYEVTWMSADDLKEFLDKTATYVDEMHTIGEHYKTNERLIEMIYEEIAFCSPDNMSVADRISRINIQKMVDRIAAEFPEIYYDDQKHLIKGVIDYKQQLIEVSESLIRRGLELISMITEWKKQHDCTFTLRNKKTGTQNNYGLLAILKVLRKFQPNILHRFKGLGENDDADIKTTIMDPNTRTLIRVQIGDIENDMKIFQMLRGNSPLDAQARKEMMRSYKIPKEMIDT